MQIWGCQNTKTPEMINIKYGMCDYVGGISQHAKIHNNRPSGGIPAHV